MATKFNLKEFMNGTPVMTKLGNPVKFVCISRDKMLVNVKHRSKIVGTYSKTVAPVFTSSVEKYNLDGKKYTGIDSEFDLVMA